MRTFFTSRHTRNNTATTGAIHGARMHIRGHSISISISIGLHQHLNGQNTLAQIAHDQKIADNTTGNCHIYFFTAYPVILETF